MDNRKIVDERILLNIPVNPNRMHQYKPGIRWEELIRTEKVLPTDEIREIGYREEKESGMFSMKMEDELETIHIPTLVVIRKRPETDDEYLKRQQTEQKYKTDNEEKEKLEYLRLKAKFEKS